MNNINDGGWRSFTQPLPALSLLLILIAVVALYWPARNGGLQFDDHQNLAGLAAVTAPEADAESVSRFIFSGAGPLGRPLALASFVPQAYAWPDYPEVFLYTNILLHILNGALLAGCLLWLGRLRNVPERQGQWVAVAGTALWLVIPLLASSSLFIVQRMTTLAAAFMLAGLLGYLAARARLAAQPRQALAGMTTSLVLGTGLAVLCKENGALLPVLALVIELTLLRANLFKTPGLLRVWAWLFLVVPLCALLVFMATKLPYPDHAILLREFNAGQRLWTQAEILWRYLFDAFLPAPARLTPFYDHWTASPSPFRPVTLLAILAWGAVIGLALKLRNRRPLLAFAVFWYLGAHLLESTVLNLELYFAHRNYIPLIGPVYALAAGAQSAALKPGAAKAVRGALGAYSLMLAVALYNFTTLWGQPRLAAEMWSVYRLDSPRAQQHLASHLYHIGEHYTALRVLDMVYTKAPERNVTLGIQALMLACSLDPNEDHSKRAETLATVVKTARLHLNVPASLMELQKSVINHPCHGVPLPAIEQIVLNAMENPAARSRNTLHNLHRILIEQAIANRDFAGTMTHLEEALRLQPSIEGLKFALQILIDAERPDLGGEFIDMVRKGIPRHPVKHLFWVRQLVQLEQQLNQALNANPKQAAVMDR